MSNPRQSLFKPGAKYLVKATIPQWPGSAFNAGEVVTFDAYKYSHYDNASVYEFKDTQGKVKEWWLGDEQAMELSAQLFGEVANETSQAMAYRVSVEQGLAAHFKQPTGSSRPGIDWMIKIEGTKRGAVIVRTYLKAAVATEQEKASLAQKALDLVQRKIESGWDPATRTGILEVSDDA